MSEQLEHWMLGKITVLRLLALVDTKITSYKPTSCDQSGVGEDIPMGRVLVIRTVSYLLKQALFPTTPRNTGRRSGADICGNRCSDKCGTVSQYPQCTDMCPVCLTVHSVTKWQM